MLGLTVAQLRSERGWSQVELATRAGLTQSHIALIERCAHPSITTATLAKLAAGFGLAGWELLKLASDPPTVPPHV